MDQLLAARRNAGFDEYDEEPEYYEYGLHEDSYYTYEKEEQDEFLDIESPIRPHGTDALTYYEHNSDADGKENNSLKAEIVGLVKEADANIETTERENNTREECKNKIPGKARDICTIEKINKNVNNRRGPISNRRDWKPEKGDVIQITGLDKSAQYNGMVGTVLNSHNKNTNRYGVRVKNGNTTKTFAVKLSNLMPLKDARKEDKLQKITPPRADYGSAVYNVQQRGPSTSKQEKINGDRSTGAETVAQTSYGSEIGNNAIINIIAKGQMKESVDDGNTGVSARDNGTRCVGNRNNQVLTADEKSRDDHSESATTIMAAEAKTKANLWLQTIQKVN